MNPIDKTPNCVKAVLDKPGYYLWVGHYPFLFEITPEKEVHQICPNGFHRDGILEPDGWTCSPDFGKVFLVTLTGPLQ